MKKIFKKILFGISLPQEYLCVNFLDFKNWLKVFVRHESSAYENDITKHHLFIGYNPLVIAIDKKYLRDEDSVRTQTFFLSFYSEDKSEIASLEVKLIHEVKLNSATCLLFEGVKGIHSFTKHFHKLIKSLHYNLTANKKKNIFLPGNLYEQVKIAYSIPRMIYLASVGSNDLYNIFPTDLSGKIGDESFIISLRTEGKANHQIENAGKCMIAKIDANYFSEVYSIGKNHMRELSNKNELGIMLMQESSDILQLPIPLGAIEYFELEKIHKFEVGIHNIHFFRIINSIQLSNSQSFLMHIHRDYAEWRIENGINTNFLIRK